MPETASDTGLLLRALAFAARKHRDQRRKDALASPYINHPIALADALANEGDVHDTRTLVAALLHDTVEDTDTTFAELEQEFGVEITSIVREVTDDKSLPKLQRKELQVQHAPRLSQSARLVKLADKICNLRDVLAAPPANWSIERRREYFAWVARVRVGLGGVNAELEQVLDGLLADVDTLA